MPRWHAPGAAWLLRDVRPGAEATYQATVEEVWRDAEGRLLARFAAEDGRRPLLEVWVQRGTSHEAGRTQRAGCSV
jgi:hypothetical protein